MNVLRTDLGKANFKIFFNFFETVWDYFYYLVRSFNYLTSIASIQIFGILNSWIRKTVFLKQLFFPSWKNVGLVFYTTSSHAAYYQSKCTSLSDWLTHAKPRERNATSGEHRWLSGRTVTRTFYLYGRSSFRENARCRRPQNRKQYNNFRLGSYILI